MISRTDGLRSVPRLGFLRPAHGGPSSPAGRSACFKAGTYASNIRPISASTTATPTRSGLHFPWCRPLRACVLLRRLPRDRFMPSGPCQREVASRAGTGCHGRRDPGPLAAVRGAGTETVALPQCHSRSGPLGLTLEGSQAESNDLARELGIRQLRIDVHALVEPSAIESGRGWLAEPNRGCGTLLPCRPGRWRRRWSFGVRSRAGRL